MYLDIDFLGKLLHYIYVGYLFVEVFMNTNIVLLKWCIVCIMLSSCCNDLIASTEYEGSTFVDINTINYNEAIKQVNNLKKDTNNNNNSTRIEYDPDVMWFDYQVLFGNVKNFVLGKNCYREVKHTNFETNTIARRIVFGDDYINNDVLRLIRRGNIYELRSVLVNINTFLNEEFERNELRFISETQLSFIKLNYGYISDIINRNINQ